MAPARKRQRLSDVGETVVVQSEPSLELLQDPKLPESDDVAPTNTDEPKPQPSRSLFVRGLASSVTTTSLAELFSESFPIKHAVAVDDPETKQCRGYGFVTFADAEDASRAKQEFDGKTFKDKKLRIEVAEARDRGDKTGAKAEAKAKRELEKVQEQQAPRLIVRNLPWSIKKDQQLAALFNKYGKVQQAYLPKRSGGLLPGFGFVVMRSRKLAEKAIQGENGKDIDGRTIAVDWAVKKEVYQQLQQDEGADEQEQSASGSNDAATDDDQEDSEDENDGDASNESDNDDSEDRESHPKEHKPEDRSATLFVRNLPFTCTDEDLEDHFTAFGNIRYARVVLDHTTGQPRGTGFVAFRFKADAETCLREAPSKILPPQAFKDGKPGRTQTPAASVLQNPDADVTGKYTMEGRVMQLSKAVDRTEATRLTEEGTVRRNQRNADRRRLYLLSEGTIPSNSKLWESLPPSERTMREASLKQRKQLIESNPSLHFSLTRLAVRNIPRSISSKELKALAREAIVGFATDVKNGKRQKLSDEELNRGGESMAEAERARRQAAKGVVRQAKVVFEGEGGRKVAEASGAGRSRGYGFIEFHTHRNALMALRWLNGHTVGYQVKDPQAKVDRDAMQDRKKRLIVEFAIENAQVVHRRAERTQNGKDRSTTFLKNTNGMEQVVDDTARDDTSTKKRKRTASASTPNEQSEQTAVDEKVAQRNRIIGRKRAMRREKRGKK